MEYILFLSAAYDYLASSKNRSFTSLIHTLKMVMFIRLCGGLP